MKLFFEILTAIVVAMIAFSWLYVAIYGCRYCAGSRSEYYETVGH